jgi:Flp pilus assembly protein TadD
MGRMPALSSPPRSEKLQSNGLGNPAKSPARAFFDVGTSCLRQGRYDEAAFYLRQSLQFQPDDPVALNNLGTVFWLTGRNDEAERYYRRAFALNPNDYSIANNLGNTLWIQTSFEEGAKFYRRALELRPDSADTWMNLGVLLTDLAQFDEAEACIQESLRLRPNSHEAHDNLGANFARQGKLKEALASYDEALRLQPNFPESRRNRGLALLTLGNFERGWAEYEWRLSCKRHVGYNPNSPRWTGDDLRGKTILLHCEQGFGDTIQIIRFVSDVRKRGPAQIIVICQRPLVRLIARYPGIDVIREERSPVPPFDVHASLWSLPAILGVTLANLPSARAYLSVDSATTEFWRAILARALGPGEIDHALKIGVVWQGNPKHRGDRMRSFRLRDFEPIARIPGARLISLQKDHGVAQLRELGEQFPVVDLARETSDWDDRRDFLDTAAVVSQLDLVITADSAVAHLAGSLGVPVWVALQSVAEWRWMIDRDDCPWYPSMRLFRQKTDGDWAGVFRRMAKVLEGGSALPPTAISS